MNFIKKMCILRQVKQGFSGDGKTLSGLIKIEQYGKNLSVEVSVINFAPLSSGEYYCLIADPKQRTEMLPLRGKSLFNIVSELDVGDGFCGVVCFVKNGITPIAYGINGDKSYDWHALVKNALSDPSANNTRETATADVSIDQAAADKSSVTQTEYNDETVATENYYRQEEGKNERVEQEETDTYAYSEGAAEEQEPKEGQDVEENGDGESVRHPFEVDSDEYYRAVKGEIDELFSTYPPDDTLKSIFAYSEWVRVKEEGKSEYLVGVIYDDLKAKYICYALPAADRESPPEEIKGVCTFVPSSAFTDKEGFFVIFQSCATGECIRAESL